MVPITTAITILAIISAAFIIILLAFGMAVSLIIAYDSIKEKDWFNCIISIIAIIVFLGIAAMMVIGFIIEV